LYGENSDYKNLEKEIVCLKVFLDETVDQFWSDEQPRVRLLQIYTTDGDSFNPTEAQAFSQRVLNNAFIDYKTRSEVNNILSEFHTRHPEYAPQAA
jgi:hypothetical protein